MKKTVKLVMLVVLVVALAAVVLQNQETWKVHFLWLSGEITGVVLLFLTAAAGFVVGVTLTLLVKHGENVKKKE
jgi:uncharacterized membrane protein YciS (DUF1049 family)